MKLQEATRREAMHIAVGVAGLSVVMQLVYFLLGKWTPPVLWSNLLGGGWAVANFILLGITVQQMAADADEKRGKLKLQFSYSLRMLGTLAVVILSVTLPCFTWIAAILPLLFPRITIFIMQITGMYQPDKKSGTKPAAGTADAEGGDEQR